MTREISPDTGNPYLTGALWPLFFKTAAPIIVLMLVSGLFTVVDAIFLGVYVGADALAAVTLVFPVFMALNALSTLVSSGMASILARRLGSGDKSGAQAAMQSATLLAVATCLVLMLAFTLTGAALISWLSVGDADLARMGMIYIAIVVYGSPLTFLIGIQGDALRSEGLAMLMAVIGVAVTLANIGFNYIFIVLMGWGVAGSAIGTLAAQVVALVIAMALRLSGRTPLTLWAATGRSAFSGWCENVKLGLPPSLTLAGVSVTSGAMIVAEQIWGGDHYAATIAAYGIVTRVMTFAFLPLMGLNLACQSIVGNNFGASAFVRSDQTLRIGLVVGLVYGIAVEAILMGMPGPIARIFVTDPATIAEMARITRLLVITYVIYAPMIMLSGYFQAIGNALAAGALGLTRPYLLVVPGIFLLPLALGETGIWLSGAVADCAMLGVAALVLGANRRRTGAGFGVMMAGRT
ncbi:MATE family efflux transporter [Martelella sp. HB161492]|uniref:MATE family efflux transporter n=1 Tax=Martelella sp. HB161492 TaxID=2720726 RepID=UPI00159068CE|nr:MATE family efflux transporter [Martelella sp. HB161492]